MVDVTSRRASTRAAGAGPNLFVIGAAKSGTTTLYELLRAHPQIFMSPHKEPRFFNTDSLYAKGEDWYRSTFFAGSDRFLVRGEATPATLFWHRKTIPRIRQYLRGAPAKFIAIFRNPVDRAYSHYWYNRQTKFNFKETLSFELALEMEDERVANDPDFEREGYVRYAYFRAGVYAPQIAAFLSAFGAEDCLMLLLEDLALRTYSNTVRTLEEFLRVKELDLQFAHALESVRYRSRMAAWLMYASRSIRAVASPYLPFHFRRRLKRTILDFNAARFVYPPMNPETRRRLVEKYQPSLHALEQLLGRNLDSWRR